MNQIDELLTRRVEQVLPNPTALKQLLESGKKIRLYQGFDPTGIKLHLGHSIGMRNLQSFVELGHEVIVLFGTGTVLVGDPSERETGRKLITQEEIEANIQTWKDQVSKIIDLERVTIKYNGDWLVPMTLKDIISLASHISAVQLFKRESFTRRIDKGDTVWFHETLYPLLQGYDSVAMDVDLEIGGTDQTFNMLVGRELQRKINNREKFVMTNPMILGTDGKQMSKSSGNCIWLDDNPSQMYGKTMSIPDNQIEIYLKLLTDLPLNQIEQLPSNPMENKKVLAFEIVKQFHGAESAKTAAEEFQRVVQDKQIPENIPTIEIQPQTNLLEVLSMANLGGSNGERKRMITQGGVSLNDKVMENPLSDIEENGVLRYGKRSYIQINLKQ